MIVIGLVLINNSVLYLKTYVCVLCLVLSETIAPLLNCEGDVVMTATVGYKKKVLINKSERNRLGEVRRGKNEHYQQ